MSATTYIDGVIPVDLIINPPGRRFLFISREQRSYTHAIHRYPAKFFPELPRWLIQRFSSPGALVLDPFCGSGTTNLEAALLGRKSVGVDVDPFARLLTRVKTTYLEQHVLVEAQSAVLHSLAADPVPDVPDFPYRDTWFTEPILLELGKIAAVLNQMVTLPAVRDFLRVVFSSVIRQASQADNAITKTTILRRKNKQVPEGFALRTFTRNLQYAVECMKSLEWLTLEEVAIPADQSATAMPLYPAACFDLAVTSPPYLTAVDYPRTHQLELYWLGFPRADREMKKRYVGTESVAAAEYASCHLLGLEQVDGVLRELYELDRKRAYIAYKYIAAMAANLREVYRVLKPGARYALVVGSNLTRGLLFETWRYVCALAPTVGFEVETWLISELINHTGGVPEDRRILDEYVVVLRKP